MKKKKLKNKFIVLVFVLSLFLFGCKGEEKKVEINEENKKLKVVTTLFPEYSFAKEILKDWDVSLLLPPGVDSHTFEPGPNDMKTLEEADMIVYTNDYMEMWFKKIRKSLKLDDEKIVDASKGIKLMKNEESDEVHDHDHDHETHHHEYDPHIWTSPKLAMKMCENIYERAIEIDPKNKDSIKKNYDDYIKKLKELDFKFSDIKKKSNGKTLYFASPFALKYFARDYGFYVRSIYKTCSSGSEPSAKDMALMIDEMNNDKAEAIYFEELTDPKIARAISSETGAKPLLFHSCHNLSKTDFDANESYYSLMLGNAKNLEEGILK